MHNKWSSNSTLLQNELSVQRQPWWWCVAAHLSKNFRDGSDHAAGDRGNYLWSYLLLRLLLQGFRHSPAVLSYKLRVSTAHYRHLFILQSCMHYPYIALLEGTGLKFGFLHMSWYTTAFNRTVYRWGTSSPKFLQQWFSLGCYTTLILLPIAIGIVLKSGADYLTPDDGKSFVRKGPILESAIPGVNLPAEDLGFYLFSLVLSSVIHEIGHALAAVREDVQLLNFGFHIVFIIPIAFVVMSTEQLHSLNAWRKLRVYSAGIWHNTVLALVAYLLFLAIPIFFGCAYQINQGVQVIEISSKSPLFGPKGLNYLDTITNINDCSVKNKLDWEDCLINILSQQWGVCVSTEFVHKFDESVHTRHSSTTGLLECCDKVDGQNLCFEYLEPPYGEVELPQHMCLPVRKILESQFNKCYVGEGFSCPMNFHCVKPILQNTTSLIVIKRINKPDVLYIGHPFDIHHTVIVSQYIPKSNLFAASIPEGFEKAMKYIIMFSIGLAVVNVFPCFVFDGQYIIQTFIHLVFVSKMKHNSLRNMSFCITLIGTVILVIVFGAMLWKQLV